MTDTEERAAGVAALIIATSLHRIGIPQRRIAFPPHRIAFRPHRTDSLQRNQFLGNRLVLAPTCVLGATRVLPTSSNSFFEIFPDVLRRYFMRNG